MSMPMQKIPVRNSEVETSWPRPVRSRYQSAPMMPATSVIAVMLSPIAPGRNVGVWFGGVALSVTPLRAENAARS